MKTLNTIQKLSKIAAVICKVLFILCVVGIVCCAVSLVFLAALPEGFVVNGMTVKAYIEANAKASIGTCYTALAVGIILCVGEAVLCKIAERYFRHELEAGTPFTFEGAKELIQLGILTICIPIGSAIASGIVHAVLSRIMTDVSDLNLNNTVSFGMGLAFVFAGLLCRSAAEMIGSKEEKQKEE